MLGGHYGEIYKICKNFSPEEKRLALLTMPTAMLEEELERRNNHYADIFDDLFKILDQMSEVKELTLDDEEEILKSLRSVLRARG